MRNKDALWFKNQVRKLRLNQRTIAKQLGISQSLISQMFIGRRQMPVHEIAQWARILDVPASIIIKRSGRKDIEELFSFCELEKLLA